MQLAAGYKRDKLMRKPLVGHLKKANTKNKRFFSEFRGMKNFDLGQEVSLSLFKSGDFVDIQAVSKGKGTAGVIKRHNFSRGPMSHGSKHHRAPGSIGISRPDKVWKGQPMPGRKGNENVTLQSLQVVKVDEKKNLLIVKGSIPGNNRSICKIYPALRKKSAKNPFILYNYQSKSANVSKLKNKTLQVKDSTIDKSANNAT